VKLYNYDRKREKSEVLNLIRNIWAQGQIYNEGEEYAPGVRKLIHCAEQFTFITKDTLFISRMSLALWKK